MLSVLTLLDCIFTRGLAAAGWVFTPIMDLRGRPIPISVPGVAWHYEEGLGAGTAKVVI